MSQIFFVLKYILHLSFWFNVIVGAVIYLLLPEFYDLKFLGVSTWIVACPLMTLIFLTYDYEHTMKEVEK